jgi:hypothetical protein
MNNKRSMFYPNGEFIPYQMPQDYRPSTGRGSMWKLWTVSQKHMFCGIFRTKGVRDTYVCNKWRPRRIKR